MADRKDIRYLNRDFTQLRAKLVDFTKTYFPNTYNDFTPSSPGMMFMEMAAYIGDVLSFYLDNQIQENYVQFARQEDNLFALAYMLGYQPKVTTAAVVDIDFYQTVPYITSGSSRVPDFSYALSVAENAVVGSASNTAITFLVEDAIDFSVSNSFDPTAVTVYQISANQPVSYLLKKTRKGISATINTTTFTVGSPQDFLTLELNDSQIIGVLDVIDSNGNTWYEVPYLAEELVYKSIKNTNQNDPNLSNDATNTPFILQTEKVARRFVTRFIDTGSLEIQFGAGTTADSTELIIPNPDNVGLGLPFEQDKLTAAYSPTNFILTNTYGIAPSNTTLTVRYLTGGGVVSNVPANDLTVKTNVSVKFVNNNLASISDANATVASLAVNNPVAAAGGQDGDSIEELRLNSLASFGSQLRAVTQDDYLIRALSMPPRYGNIAKAFIQPQKVIDLLPGEVPSVLDLYVLTYNNSRQLAISSQALKQNLSTYLSQYRMVNDSVKIKDAFIINIGVNFDIIVLPNYNNNQVLNSCILALKVYFDINNWQINQPIILRNIYTLLDQVEGVQTVKNISIVNKAGISSGYSQFAYDVVGATQDNVVYPSIDPMIFEVKYPDSDIQGRVVPL
jgi:hypothetical protein